MPPLYHAELDLAARGVHIASMQPADPASLFALFEKLGINAPTLKHQPVFRVGEGDDVKAALPGAHTKNLFLKSKKGHYCLVTMLDDAALDLKAFSKMMSLGSFSFASAERLMEKLAIMPGSVTPFAIMNDAAKDVTLVLDKDMMAADKLNFHPLSNDQTTTITRPDFLKFLEHVGHAPHILDLPKILTPAPQDL